MRRDIRGCTSINDWILGAYVLNDYEVILDSVGKYLIIKKGFRLHEFFYCTVTRTRTEIKLTAKPDHWAQQVLHMSLKNRQISKSNTFFEDSGKIKLNSTEKLVLSVHNVAEGRSSISCTKEPVKMGSRGKLICDEMEGAYYYYYYYSVRCLSDDSSKASSKTIPPHSAIQSLLFKMRLSSPVLKVIQ